MFEIKKTVIILFIIYTIVYALYPLNSNSSGSDSTTKIEAHYEKGYIVLDKLNKDSSERYWGQFNNNDFMVYKGIGKYIYVNGSFDNINGKWINDNFYIPEEEAKDLFNLKGANGTYISNGETEGNICRVPMNKEKVLEVLSDLSIPIEEARVTKEPGQLPGSDRDYRHGKHEGFDWYAGAIGREISRETKVHPIFEGEIVRIDKQFKELETNYRDSLLEEAAVSGNTPQKTLDLLRGRQVWVQSDNGVLIHYAHLDSVNTELKVGDKVSTEDWIARVGNSGTSNGALGTDEDLHLHSDILVCGKNFWEYGEIPDMNAEMIKIFDKVAEKEADKNEQLAEKNRGY